MRDKLTALFARLKLRVFLFLGYITLLPVLLFYKFWFALWSKGWPRAWDGSGHYGILQVYDKFIVPDTFGWTHAYFGGMPFPNFYPPIFYWCVSILHHTGMFSLESAFKLLIILPVLLMPVTIWALAWVLSQKNLSVTAWASLFSIIPLADPRFSGSLDMAQGLDYFSTFGIGMYAHVFGFILLIAWYVVYINSSRNAGRLTLASLLLALTVLTSFFNAIVATILVMTVVAVDVKRYIVPADSVDRCEARRALSAHIVTPLIAACLSAFWLAPMFNEYDYFVTRPFFNVMITPSMWALYICSGIGFFWWSRLLTRALYSFFAACSIMLALIMVSALLAPGWLPLQAHRFIPNLTFLLCAPAGFFISKIMSTLRFQLCHKFGLIQPFKNRIAPYSFAAFLILLAISVLGLANSNLMRTYVLFLDTVGFYPQIDVAPAADYSQAKKDLSSPAPVSNALDTTSTLDYAGDHGVASGAESLRMILGFAQRHQDGRYLVELPAAYNHEVNTYDSRAINSYLGGQGNETIVVVFREASPNSLFMFPQMNAFSTNSDNFGISSVLADDIDFYDQPLETHLNRSQFLGVRYLVIFSQSMKERLAKEPIVGDRYDFGGWSVFQLKNSPPSQVQALVYRPALVVTDFTLKRRRVNEYNFIRYAEEQFAESWFDVLLVRSEELMADRLGDESELSKFGALILDTYKCDDCLLAFNRLRGFSQKRPLILLASDASLFHRIRANLSSFPYATIIERATNDPGMWAENVYGPNFRGQSSPVRNTWNQIRLILDKNKVEVKEASLKGDVHLSGIHISSEKQSEPNVPALIRTTFHPKWKRHDNEKIYSATPMFMLTFINGPAQIKYTRNLADYAALWMSAVTFAILVIFAGYSYCHRRIRVSRNETKVWDEAIKVP